EQPRLLIDGAAVLPHRDLPPRLRLDRLHHEAHRVDVLDFAARAERLARMPHGDVHVRAQRSLLHVAVARAEVAQDRAYLAQIGAGLLGTAQVGLADDLHQRHTRTVEVDIRLRRMLVVQALAGVLLQVQPRDADLLGAAVGELDLHRAGADDRVRVLADLIAGWQVGVEVVLAVETAGQIDVRVQAQTGAHRLCDALPVDHRQHARERRIDEADLRVRLGSERGRRAAEQFRVADHLRMHFQPDHDLPGSGAAVERVGRRVHLGPLAHAASSDRSGFASKPAAASIAALTANTVSSSNGRPITCSPSGSPFASSPAGTLIPGTPAMLAGTVNTSLRYIFTGSSMFSPCANAALGAVGVTSASTWRNASVKSRRIKARTFCARR